MSRTTTIILLLFAALFASPSAAEDSPIQRLLKLSFACPTASYHPNVITNDEYTFLDRYRWDGSEAEFKVHDDVHRMIKSIRGVDVEDLKTDVSAAWRDLAEVHVDGLDVGIGCRGDRECVSVRSIDQGGEVNVTTMSETSFRACDASTASDMAMALRRQIGGNR